MNVNSTRKERLIALADASRRGSMHEALGVSPRGVDALEKLAARMALGGQLAEAATIARGVIALDRSRDKSRELMRLAQLLLDAAPAAEA